MEDGLADRYVYSEQLKDDADICQQRPFCDLDGC